MTKSWLVTILPVSGRLFLDVHLAVTWMLNEFLKGVLNKLWRVPAFKRSFGESTNLKKLTHCRCWPLGCAQCFNFWILNFFSGTKIDNEGDFFHSDFSTRKIKRPNLIIPPVFGFGRTYQMVILTPYLVSNIEQNQKSSISYRIQIFSNVLWIRE